MKKNILIVIFLITSNFVFSQQDEIYTQFFTNKLAINPAYAGSKETLNLLAFYRTQWVGFDGSPKTLSFTAHSPIMKNTSGVGISVIQDNIGLFQNTIMNLNYAYRIEFPFGKLSLGLSGRMQRKAVDWTKTNPLSYNDNSIPVAANNLFLPNFGTGAYFYNDKFYVGLSVPHLFNNKYKFDQTSSVETEANAERHYFAMAGAIFNITTDVKLQPSMQYVYAKNSPMELDLNLSLLFYNTFVVGASLRTKDSYSFVCQIWLDKNIACGYSHDFAYSNMSPYHSGTHEIFISYDIPLKGFGVENPRFF